jgi:hypothetical protein
MKVCLRRPAWLIACFNSGLEVFELWSAVFWNLDVNEVLAVRPASKR